MVEIATVKFTDSQYPVILLRKLAKPMTIGTDIEAPLEPTKTMPSDIAIEIQCLESAEVLQKALNAITDELKRMAEENKEEGGS